MRTSVAAMLLALSCAPLAAQKSLLFTGRFPFTSLDDVNDINADTQEWAYDCKSCKPMFA